MAIDIEKLTQLDVGRNVVFDKGGVGEELGHITSWNDVNVFVDYGYSCGRGIASSPERLDFVFSRSVTS